MSVKDNGGWAFPQPMFQHSNGEVYGAGSWDNFNGGMTLRDWFAGQALNACLDYHGPHERVEAAKTAYAVADAMLAESAK